MGEEIIRVRRKKIERLRAAGVNPFPYRFARTHTLSEVRERFAELQAAAETVRVAGRVMLHRVGGKLTFFHVEDMDARMQFSGRHDEMGAEAYQAVKALDIGDIIGAEGTLWQTDAGEPTIGVKRLELLCKSLRPLPEKYHGLKDKEIRYRQRDLDWIMNADVRQVFVTRARAIAEVRRFMDGRGFLEVDVPYMHTTYGGGEARPFKTHINAIDTRAYLSISPELFLKRYLVGGFDAVYCIARNFRNEGIDAAHNPEFTMMEAYQAYGDYRDGMALIEDLFVHVFTAILGQTTFEYAGRAIDVAKPWKRLPVYDGLKDAAGLDARALSRDELAAEIQRRAAAADSCLGDIDLGPHRGKGHLVLDLFDHYVGDKIVQPTFVIDYPRDTSPLCKVHRDDPQLIERFEPILCGLELGNAYSELNDPVEQRQLLEEQATKLRAGLDEASPMDEAFARAIEYGMPPASGLGLGIDRMIMLLCGATSIRDVIAFPLMRPLAAADPKQASQASDAPPREAAREPEAGGETAESVEWNEPEQAGIDLETAHRLLDEHITNPATKAHCLASAAAMRGLALKLGRDPERADAWAIAGLLHDLDFQVEQAPDKHGLKTKEWCLAAGMDERLVHAMIVHNDGLGIPRQSAFEHLLAAAETLTGLVRAVALVHPGKKIAGVKPKSVTKRLKDKRFAAKVNRQIIRECERAGVSVEELAETTLAAMKEIAAEIGL